MARAALDWSTQDLARAASVGVNTVNRFEAGQDARVSSVDKMRAALEAAGVIFVAENGEGPGVRLRKSIHVSLTDEELLSRYLDKGPCLVRGAGGEESSSLRHALDVAKSKPMTTSIEILGQAAGQIVIKLDQIKRLLARIAAPA